MTRKYIMMICFTLLMGWSVSASSQGISFFKGTFDEALAKAKQENKLVFVDFYATWCGPCKQMAEKVFTDEEVGKYMNDKFVCMQIDVEKEGWQKETARNFNVTVLPTLIFFKADASVASRLAGAREKADLLNAAKVVCGEQLSFEKLYDRAKSKKDLADMQLVLKQAPDYVGGLEGMEAQKWIVRIDKLYAEYAKMKMGPDFINKEDFQIVSKFNKKNVKDDAVMNFMAKNLEAYMNKLGEAPGILLVEYNNKVIEQLSKAGKEEYKKYLERINGDLEAAYAIMPTGALTPYEKFKYYYDGMYLLAYKKDAASYVELMNKYLAALGDQVGANDYGEIAQNMYVMSKGKLNNEQLGQVRDWLVKAMQYEGTGLIDRINFVTMLGDTYKALKQFDKAKDAYNQGYMEALQIENKMRSAQIQMIMKRKLQSLELAK
ncbi:thioredoxin family protein [Butyricimonas paravirosa]|uniref:thioredoxin family protein n=2 Tax=Butyricimonas paravirosa TaxID=1472417 RepID=UPI002A82E76B|nr:thioredoxin family protein [Butyricimonas paravirosa]